MNPTDPSVLFESNFHEDANFGDLSSGFLSSRKWIRLKPYGMQISADGLRPMLLLKDEKGELTLPVAINHLEAGVALTQSNKEIPPTTPHRVTEVLLEALALHFESCFFVEIKGSYQYVRLYIKGHPDLKFIKVRADEAMSFCLHLNVPIYATLSFIERSKVLSAELGGQAQGLRMNPELLAKQHKYLM